MHWLPPVEDRGLQLWGQEGQWDSGSDVGLGPSGLAGDLGERRAPAQGPCPEMRFGERSLQNLVGRGNSLARDDPGLDSPAAQGKGAAESQEPVREGCDWHLQRRSDHARIKLKLQLARRQSSRCNHPAGKGWLTSHPVRQCGRSAHQFDGTARFGLCQKRVATVTRPDGVKLIYTSVGALVGDTSTAGTPEWNYARTGRWLLTRIEDTQATPNAVTYTYAFTAKADGYAPRPVRIDFAGYAVEFTYRDYPANAIAKFATGSSLMGRQLHQLRSIRVFDGTTPIRAYRLVHTTSALTQTQLLASVTEFGADFVATGVDITGGSALPATEFQYSVDQVSFFEATAANTPSLAGKEFHEAGTVIDWNRDGADDLLFAERALQGRAGTSNNGYTYPVVHTFASGLFTFARDRSLVALPSLRNVCAATYPTDPSTGDPRRRWQDGIDILSTDRASADLYCLNHAYGRTLSGQDNQTLTYNLSVRQLSSAALPITVSSFPQLSDFLGTVYPASASGKQYDLDAEAEIIFGNLHEMVGGQFVADLSSSGAIRQSGAARATVDVTGDGVDDLVHNAAGAAGFGYFPNSVFKVLPEPGSYAGIDRPRATVLDFGAQPPVFGSATAQLNCKGEVVGYGDLDTDGLTDQIIHCSNGSSADTLLVRSSTGRGFRTVSTFVLANYLSATRGYATTSSTDPRTTGHRTAFRDLNGDGLVDVLLHDGFTGPISAAPYTSGNSWILINSGTGFQQLAVRGSLAGFVGMIAVGDFDGDGLQDIALEGKDPTTAGGGFGGGGGASHPGRSILFGNGGIPNRMTSVKSSAGAVTTVAYAPSSDFGVNQMPGIQHVVKTLTVADGRGNATATEFSYAGGRYDFTNRRTLGYRTVTVTLPALPGEVDPIKVVTTYHNTHLAEYGLIEKREILQGTTVLASESNGYAILYTGNGPWRADRTSSRKATLFGAALIETSLTREVNAFGQVTRETALGFTANGVDLDPSDNVTVTMGYSPNLLAYIVDRPSIRREEAGLTPTAALSDDLSYAAISYDGAAANTTAPTVGNLTKVEEWTGSTAAPTLRTARLLTYDTWGNVLTETDARAAAAGTGPSVSYAYDTTKHLFRLTTTNALGHVETAAWNTLCQAPSSITDPNLRVTTKTYDTFCRETRTDLPGGQYLITRYVSFGTPTLQHVERETRSGSATPGRDLSISREYFDGLGRPWAATQPGTTSAIADATLQLSAYDARGNLAWTSLPLPFSSLNTTPNAAQRTSFTYDGLNRAVETILPDGAKRSQTFLTVSLSHFGGPTLAYPASRSLDEHCFDATAANTICGEAVQISDAAGRLIRSDRNDTALTDLDAGGQALRSTSYRYDAKGSLTQVTDPGGISFAYTYDVFGNRLTADDPGLGHWTLTYDANNNLLTQTDAKGQLISFAYDALNRVTLKTVGTGPARVETRFTYDQPRAGFYNKGRETTQEVWTPTGTTHSVERDWHLMGGLAVERHTIDGRTYALETSFAPNGAPLDQKLPGTPGATTTGWVGPFSYDAADRLTAFTGYITSVTYNAWGQPTAAAYANGVSEAYAYDPARGWLTSVTGTLPGGDMAFRAGYDRSATGRIFRADTQALVGGSPTDTGGSYDYAYDYTGRLLAATNWRGATGVDQVFAYDRAGRIRSKGATLASAMTYDYADPLTPDHAPGAVTAAGVTTDFTYDANGNMLTGLAGKIMTYDGENRPLSVTHLGKRTCYVYGIDGKRLKKVEGLPPTQDCTALPANTNATVYFGAVEVRNWLVAGAEQVLTYPHPAVKLLNGTTPATATYLHRDGLGSVRAITDAAGVKIESALYKPFGEQSEWLLPGNAAPETKGWIGERYDADAGLQYLNARYYDPELSLFLQPDWFEVTKAGVGTNRFSYSFNDPVNKMDPGGNESAKKKAAEVALKAAKEAADQARKEAYETAKTQAKIRNSHLAGKPHEKSGIMFDKDGFPDFSGHLYKGGKNEVNIEYSGNRTTDAARANKAAGYDKTPDGYRWHHHQDCGKMQLVEKGAHEKAGHTGGFDFSKAAIEAGGQFDGAIRAAETILNSRTMKVLDLIDPTTFLDIMHESATGYSIWDSEEDRFDKCVAAGKCS